MSTRTSRREAIMAEASRWFTRRRLGEMNAADVLAFEAWLNEGSEKQTALRSVERAWASMALIQDDEALEEVNDHDDGALHEGRRRQMAAIAAGMLVAIGGAGWFVAKTGLIDVSAWISEPPSQAFSTTIGQRATTTLIDGSIVTLDTDSALRVRVTGQKRLVELERGRAFFKVARDKSRPFIVTAAGKTVRATGTAFDVRVDEGRFEVTLLEGRVQVREAGAQREGMPEADLRQGWRLAVGDDTRWRMEPVDLTQATAWHDGMLVFRDEPLAQAVAEMNRYSRRKITFRGDPPNKSVLGRFQAGDVDAFARGLELNKVARIVSQTDEEIEIAAR